MTTDYKALCAELVELDRVEPGDYAEWRQRWTANIKRARAALAETYEAEANNPPEGHPDPEPFQAVLRERAAALAESVPEPPADGEVAELVAWLRDRADSTSLAHAARRIIRVADLLECLAVPEPVQERDEPSLKEQALARLASLEKLAEAMGHNPNDTIRRALEQLND